MNMKKVWAYIFLLIQLSLHAQAKTAEDYYVSAFNEMSDMLAGRDTLSIKRAVYLAEWAFYEGNLDYKTDFCDEIDRIKTLCVLYDGGILRYNGGSKWRYLFPKNRRFPQ